MSESTDSFDAKEHWETIYNKYETEELGWYEENPEPSLQLIDRCNIVLNDPLLDIGAGASTLIDALVERKFITINVVDISHEALERLHKRLSSNAMEQVRFIRDDVTNPGEILDLSGKIKLWHDRAMLHFLLNEEDRQQYRQLLHQLVSPHGYVIIAVFAEDGVEKCSGLEVKRYSVEEIRAFLGEEFRLQESFRHVYTTPGGEDRPYNYTLFKRE